MDIMELGAIGELVGGVAVVGSLIFVGLQIRHNSASIEQTGKVAGGTMHQETNRSYADFFRLIAENPELASIYCKGRQGAELDPIEVARYEALLQVHFAWLEVNHTQEKLGFRGELAEPTTLEITGPYSRQLLTGSYAKEWWERDARYQYVPDFYREATPILLGERGPSRGPHPTRQPRGLTGSIRAETITGAGGVCGGQAEPGARSGRERREIGPDLIPANLALFPNRRQFASNS